MDRIMEENQKKIEEQNRKMVIINFADFKSDD